MPQLAGSVAPPKPSAEPSDPLLPISVSCRGIARCAAAGLFLAALLAGCATPPTDPAERDAFEQNNDPLEPLNREIFGFNQFLDRVLLAPVAKIYVAIVPEDGRDAIRRLLDNMKEPTLFFNNVLQGEFERAGITLGRFTINTTLGLVGLFDVAAKLGLERQPADFGQTLFVWGFPEGPYLILPILGPSNPRDAIGMGVDSYADPFALLASVHGIQEWTNARLIADGIDRRARVIDVLEDLEKNSLDYYAQLRSLSQQHRAAELRRGAAPGPSIEFYVDPSRPQPPPGKWRPPPAAPAGGNPPASPRP
jgi:phospholipid-binding lipoprotein MlaA